MRRLSLWLAIAFCLATETANARDLFEKCDGKAGAIQTQDVGSDQVRGYYKAAKLGDEWVIYVNRNSRFDYLSTETLNWLYFRQCYFAISGTTDAARSELSTAEEADCSAVQRLRDGYGYSDLQLRAIEYDLETLAKDANAQEWEELLGPRRSVYLLKCY